MHSHCLYCGKRLSFFHNKKKPFCSEVHEDRHRDAQSRAGFNRLMEDPAAHKGPAAPFGATPAKAPDPGKQTQKEPEKTAEPERLPPMAYFLAESGGIRVAPPSFPIRNPNHARFPAQAWPEQTAVEKSRPWLSLDAARIAPGKIEFAAPPAEETVVPAVSEPPISAPDPNPAVIQATTSEPGEPKAETPMAEPTPPPLAAAEPLLLPAAFVEMAKMISDTTATIELRPQILKPKLDAPVTQPEPPAPPALPAFAVEPIAPEPAEPNVIEQTTAAPVSHEVAPPAAELPVESGPAEPPSVEPVAAQPQEPEPPAPITALAQLDIRPLPIVETLDLLGNLRAKVFAELPLSPALPGLAGPILDFRLAPIPAQETLSPQAGSYDQITSPEPVRFRTPLNLDNPILRASVVEVFRRGLAPAPQVPLDWHAIAPGPIPWQFKPIRRQEAILVPTLKAPAPEGLKP